MKNLIAKCLALVLCILIYSCQYDHNSIDSEVPISESESTTEPLSKNGNDYMIVCSSDGIPSGYQVVEYFSVPFGMCSNTNLFLGLYNAAEVRRIPITPRIDNGGPGCADNYCVWLRGRNYESNSYVDVRTVNGSNIISTYRGSDRVQYKDNQGRDIITLALRTQYEKNLFASQGLRFWVVNPQSATWSNAKFIKRPPGSGGPDPDINPCPGGVRPCPDIP